MPTDVAHEPTSIEDREARIEEIDARLAELDEAHAGTVMPDEAREEWNELNDERDQHKAAVTELRRRRERMQTIAGNPKATERAETGTPALARKRLDGLYDVSRLRAESSSEEDYRARLNENAMRAIERAQFPVVAGRKDVRERVEQLLASDDKQGTLARRILVTGAPAYQRAFGRLMETLNQAALSAEEQRALSVGVDASGGFAVPFQLDPSIILTSDGSINPLRQVARVETITTKTWQGVTSAGITVTRHPEAGEADDDSPTLAQPEVTPTRVQAFVPFSLEIDQDWGTMQGEITRLIEEAKADEEAEAFVTGDGTGNNPGGLVATLAAGSVVAASAVGDVTVPDDLNAVEEAVPPRFRGRSSWLANRSIYNRIRRNAISSGITAEEIWARIGPGLPPELSGYPARELSSMDGTIEASGGGTSDVLLFGDYRTGFMIVDRLGMTVELVPHLFGANRRPTGQRGIYAVWRNSSVILVDNAIRLLRVTSAV